MAEAIDTLIAVIGSDVRGFVQGVQRVNSDLDSLSGRLTKFGTNTAALGGIITAATLPLVAMAKQGIETASAFDSVMKQLELFGNLSQKELEAARDIALQVGADTIFTAQDTAKAMLEMRKQGIAYADVLKMIRPAADLATVGNMTLAQSSDAMGNVMAIFDLKADQSQRVINGLAQAANASRADVADLTQALISGGTVAKQYGLSYEDTLAALGILSDRGIKGAQAGTALRSMLNNMTRGVKKSENAWKQLGMEMFDAQGKMRPMSDIIADMDKVLDKVPDKTRLQIVKDLAGTYGQTSLFALLSEGSLKRMRAEMAKAPTAASVAAKAADTFDHSIESLMGSVETLNIRVFTPFMNNVLKPLVNQMIPIINKWADWAKANEGLVSNILKVVAAVTLLGPAIAIVGAGITAIGAVLGVVTGPIGLIIAGVVALAAAFQTNFLGIQDAVMGVINFLKPTFDAIIGFVQNFMNLFFAPGNFDFNTRLALAFAGIQMTLPKLIGQFEELFQGVASWISAVAVPKVVKEFEDLLGKVGDWLSSGGPGKLAEGLGGLISGVVTWLTTTAVPTVVDGFRKLWDGVVSFFQSEGVQKFITGLGDWLSATYKWFTDVAMPSIVDGMVQGILNFFKWLNSDGSVQFQNSVRDWFTQAINWVGTVAIPELIKLINDFIDEITNLGGKITDALNNSIRKGLNMPEGAPNPIPQASGAGGNAILDTVKNAAGILPGGGIMGSILEGMFGGGRAGGGPVQAGMNYLVGERGPELLSMGSRPGFITPSGMGGGGGNMPDRLEVVLQADGFEERIVLKLAEAQRMGRLRAQAT